jgi:hypothetical protein
MDIPGSAVVRPLFVAVLLTAAASAASSARAQGTEEERRACTPDVMNLCREFIPSVSAITQCLIDRRAELSPACQLVMTPPRPDPVRQAAEPAKRRAAGRHPDKPAPTASSKALRPKTAAVEPRAANRPLNILPVPTKRPAAKPKRAAKPAAKKAANGQTAGQAMTARSTRTTAAP